MTPRNRADRAAAGWRDLRPGSVRNKAGFFFFFSLRKRNQLIAPCGRMSICGPIERNDLWPSIIAAMTFLPETGSHTPARPVAPMNSEFDSLTRADAGRWRSCCNPGPPPAGAPPSCPPAGYGVAGNSPASMNGRPTVSRPARLAKGGHLGSDLHPRHGQAEPNRTVFQPDAHQPNSTTDPGITSIAGSPDCASSPARKRWQK